LPKSLARISHQNVEVHPAPAAPGARDGARQPREMRAFGETAPGIATHTWPQFCLTTAPHRGLASRRQVRAGGGFDGAVSLEPGFLVRNPG